MFPAKLSRLDFAIVLHHVCDIDKGPCHTPCLSPCYGNGNVEGIQGATRAFRDWAIGKTLPRTRPSAIRARTTFSNPTFPHEYYFQMQST